MKRNIQSFACVCLLGLITGLCSGCTDSILEQEKEAGDIIECTFKLDAGSPATIDTRVIGMDGIGYVWVVQLNEAGTSALVPPVKVSSTISKEISLKLKNEKSKLYFFANVNNEAFFDTGATLSTFTTSMVENKIYNFADLTYWDNLMNKSRPPMYGIWSGTPSSPEIADPIELTRAVAYISFTITDNTSGKFVLSTAQLRNIPSVLKLAPTESGTYPDASGTFLDYPTITTNVGSYVVSENCRGTGSGRYETEKTAAAVSNGNKATYLEIKGTYNGIGITYCFYLGGNSTNDYNVRRNTQYTVNITLSGSYRLDARVTVEASPMTISSGASVNWGDGSNATLDGNRN